MRTAKDFIKPDDIIKGTFMLNKEKHSLGIQEDGSVLFKRPDDKRVYRGFMLCGGYAVSIVGGKK